MLSGTQKGDDRVRRPDTEERFAAVASQTALWENWPRTHDELTKKKAGPEMKPLNENRCKHLADSDIFLTRKQLGLRYNVTRKTLANWAARGYGPPCVRVGKQPLYRLCCVKDGRTATSASPRRDRCPDEP